MKKTALFNILALGALALTGLTGCSDDDSNPVMPAMTEGSTFTLTIENVSMPGDHFASGSFAVPVGAGGPAPIGPGQAYEFEVGAVPGDRLSFATMFVHSNDLFFAPDAAGIALYNQDGTPRMGDVTSEVMLWDAGTEANEAPGLGPNQAPRQGGANTGPADPDMNVRMVNDGFTYPAVGDVITVTLAPHGDGSFTVRIENTSSEMTLQPQSGTPLAVPLAPGVFVVHTTSGPLFTPGSKDLMAGLEALAEDGNPGMLADDLGANTRLATPLAPGALAVHKMGAALFREGMNEGGSGLENLAEDGDPSTLVGTMAAMADVSVAATFAVPVDATDPAPIGPGQSYQISFTAEKGDMLSFATMFVQSNDLFYGLDDSGYMLFNADGTPRSGDLTSMVQLWDAGTEQNQWPGAGPDQAPRQAGANHGARDMNRVVRAAVGSFDYPNVSDVVRVTLSVEP